MLVGVQNPNQEKSCYMLGNTELLLILSIGILLFGASAIPRLARSLGRVRSEFEKGIKEGDSVSPPKEGDSISPKKEKEDST